MGKTGESHSYHFCLSIFNFFSQVSSRLAQQKEVKKQKNKKQLCSISSRLQANQHFVKHILPSESDSYFLYLYNVIGPLYVSHSQCPVFRFSIYPSHLPTPYYCTYHILQILNPHAYLNTRTVRHECWHTFRSHLTFLTLLLLFSRKISPNHNLLLSNWMSPPHLATSLPWQQLQSTLFNFHPLAPRTSPTSPYTFWNVQLCSWQFYLQFL